MLPSASKCGSQMQSGLVSCPTRSFSGMTCTRPPVHDVAPRLDASAGCVGVDESSPVYCPPLSPEQPQPPSFVRQNAIKGPDIPAPEPHASTFSDRPSPASHPLTSPRAALSTFSHAGHVLVLCVRASCLPSARHIGHGEMSGVAGGVLAAPQVTALKVSITLSLT